MKYILLCLLLQQYLEVQHERLGFSGVLLIAKKDSIVYQETIGMASRELNVPINKDNRFKVASVTKSFTAWLIVQAAKEGKLRLTDPLSSYIPNRWPEITIEQLLTHTSGIPHNEGIKDYWTIISRLPLTKEQALEAILEMKLLPKGMHYSSPGYFLLACILEKVYQTSYEKVLAAKLPLLKNTGIYNVRSIIPPLTAGYHMMGDSLTVAPYRDPSLMKGSGDLYTTAEDLLKWNNTCTDFNYGWMKEGDAYYHGGGSFGCSAINVVYPKDSLSIILLSNVSVMPVNEMWHDIEKIVFNQPFEMPQVNAHIKIEDLAKFSGKYESEGTTLQIIAANDQLYAKLGSNPAFEIYANTPLEFSGKKVNVRIIFKQDEKGNVTGLQVEGRGRPLHFIKNLQY
ncbi:serine hydrolase domain-containing protein [Chitinophaga niabensis]|uniref:Beta-lactamase n=1 Tax=Chitinophaga niabensis TaxID=536979 RepID=A0A1N6F5L1_9BACT|nr:serine hydrolase domain-containing protein [Chitinophaga niabensis]SIN90539.1 Beta-lactamase [Chitinophaga niabensis]